MHRDKQSLKCLVVFCMLCTYSMANGNFIHVARFISSKLNVKREYNTHTHIPQSFEFVFEIRHSCDGPKNVTKGTITGPWSNPLNPPLLCRVCIQMSVFVCLYAEKHVSFINQWPISFSFQWNAELTAVIVRDTVTFTAQVYGDSFLYLAVCDYLRTTSLKERNNDDMNVTLERCDSVEKIMEGMKKLTSRANWLQVIDLTWRQVKSC